MLKKTVLFYLGCIVLLGGCTTTGRGSRGLVFDLGDGTAEYRTIQGDIRNGETELAITGTKLEGESRELRNEIGQIGGGIRELEQAISGSQEDAEEVGAIIQRVRTRPVDPAFVDEWRNRQSGRQGCNGKAGEGKI